MRGRFSHHALTNLSSKMMANWAGLAPFAWRHFPVCATLAQDGIQQFDCSLIGWKMASRSHGAPQFGVQGFDGVRGVNDAPHSDGKKAKNGMKPLPVAPPALRDCRILAAPDAGVEILQRPAGHVRVRRPVDRFEFSGDRLAVFP